MSENTLNAAQCSTMMGAIYRELKDEYPGEFAFLRGEFSEAKQSTAHLQTVVDATKEVFYLLRMYLQYELAATVELEKSELQPLVEECYGRGLDNVQRHFPALASEMDASTLQRLLQMTHKQMAELFDEAAATERIDFEQDMYFNLAMTLKTGRTKGIGDELKKAITNDVVSYFIRQLRHASGNDDISSAIIEESDGEIPIHLMVTGVIMQHMSPADYKTKGGLLAHIKEKIATAIESYVGYNADTAHGIVEQVEAEIIRRLEDKIRENRR